MPSESLPDERDRDRVADRLLIWAAVVFVGLGAWVLLGQFRSRGDQPSDASAESAVPRTVAADERPVLALSPGSTGRLVSPGSEWALLSLEVRDIRFRTYRVSLLAEESREEAWRADSLVLDEGGHLIVAVHGTFLQPGDYRFFVEGIESADTSRAVGLFPLKIVEK